MFVAGDSRMQLSFVEIKVQASQRHLRCLAGFEIKLPPPTRRCGERDELTTFLIRAVLQILADI